MSNQLAILNGAQVPAAFHSLMSQMQTSELSQNVGASYAVVSFKGKVFRIKHGGTETPLTIVHNGQTFAAPYYDVLILAANPQLSKTYYPSGYTEGSDDAPKCWSEDGHTPLAPLADRPVMANGQPCSDCSLCPMNVFGSKVNTETGTKGKACSDTRKLVLVPLDEQGQIDFTNQRYGGPMLMRVPAASLSVFAEYDRRLQSMGFPYFAVVTRLTFDQSVAYPKFQLTPARPVTEAEAREILALREDPQVKAILSGGHASAPEAAAPALPAAQPPAAAPMPAPAPATAAPMPSPAPTQAAPMPPAAPAPAPAAVAPPAPMQAPPAAPAAPAPAPMPAAPPAQMAPPPPMQAPPAAFQPEPMPAAAPAAAPAQTATQPTVSQELLNRVDQLLQS